MKNGDSDQSCSYYQINFSIPDCRCICLDFGLFFDQFLLVPSLINELNKISDVCSFYICIRITILSLKKRKIILGTSLVVQWLRICPAMQGTQVPSLIGELRSHMPWDN